MGTWPPPLFALAGVVGNGGKAVAIHGHLDGFEGAFVVGWAYDDRSRDSARIEIRTTDGEPIAAGWASRIRDDLEALGIGRTDLAFRIRLPADCPPGAVHVFADDRELDGSPIHMEAQAVDGGIASARGRVTGWASRRLRPDEQPLVELVDDEGRVVLTPALKRRADADEGEPFRFDAEMPDLYLGQPAVNLRLRADGQVIGATAVAMTLRGYVDEMQVGRCYGWLYFEPDPARRLVLDVRVDGRRVAGGPCAVNRPDLLQSGMPTAECGFDFSFPVPGSELAAYTLAITVAATDTHVLGTPLVIGRRHAYLDIVKRLATASLASPVLSANDRSAIQFVLRDAVDRLRRGPAVLAAPHIHRHVERRGAAPTTVVIPVYKGVEVTRRCILSVLDTITPGRHRVLVVNDNSPEPDMAAMLAGFAGEPLVEVLENPENLGFVRTVNRAFDRLEEGDVLLLNSDTLVYPGGIDELERVLASDPTIATVTPLSNNATIFSYPSPDDRRDRLDDMDWPAVAAEALAANGGAMLDVPTGHGFCLLIGRHALDRVPLFDERFGRGYGEENAFCLTLADLGFRNVAAPGAFVFHQESVSFGHLDRKQLIDQGMAELGGMFPEYLGTVMAFQREGGLRRARWQLDRVRLQRAGKRFVVSIEHAHGGGSAQAADDLLRALDAENRTLRVLIGPDGLSLRSAAPLVDARFAADEFGDLLALLADLEPETVVVHAAIGLGPDQVAALTAFAGKHPVVFLAHDFYAACPRVNLIDASGRYCGVAPVAKCDRCVELGGRHAFAREVAPDTAGHRRAMAGLLGAARHVVAPSDDTAAHLARAFPDLAITSLPHREVRPPVPRRTGTPDPTAVVLLGAIGPHKGSRALVELAERAYLERPDIHFHLIGYSDIDDQLKRFGNVTVYGPYLPDALPGLLRRANGSFALFLHLWPETFSYTLSEALAHGLFPLVPDLGAPAERVRESGTGVVFPFPFSVDEVLGTLARCMAEGVRATPHLPAGPDAAEVRAAFLG